MDNTRHVFCIHCTVISHTHPYTASIYRPSRLIYSTDVVREVFGSCYNAGLLSAPRSFMAVESLV
jgi:hypothetical protein